MAVRDIRAGQLMQQGPHTRGALRDLRLNGLKPPALSLLATAIGPRPRGASAGLLPGERLLRRRRPRLATISRRHHQSSALSRAGQLRVTPGPQHPLSVRAFVEHRGVEAGAAKERFGRCGRPTRRA
jgi:hypothetical protein